MEMTGLDVQNDRILEVACAITDNDLNILAKHPTIVIHQSDAVFDAMGEWCKTTHAQVRHLFNSFYSYSIYLAGIFVFI